jgi:hypothetical protein
MLGRAPLAHVAHRPVDDSQRLRAQSELRAGAFDPLHVELGRRNVGARIAIERNELGERPIADDDAGGVGGGVAVEALELQGDVEELGDALLVAAGLL